MDNPFNQQALDLKDKPARNFCLPENRWRMEDGRHGKDTMEIQGKKEEDRKRQPVSEQWDAVVMARV